MGPWEKQEGRWESGLPPTRFPGFPDPGERTFTGREPASSVGAWGDGWMDWGQRDGLRRGCPHGVAIFQLVGVVGQEQGVKRAEQYLAGSCQGKKMHTGRLQDKKICKNCTYNGKISYKTKFLTYNENPSKYTNFAKKIRKK